MNINDNKTNRNPIADKITEILSKPHHKGKEYAIIKYVDMSKEYGSELKNYLQAKRMYKIYMNDLISTLLENNEMLKNKLKDFVKVLLDFENITMVSSEFLEVFIGSIILSLNKKGDFNTYFSIENCRYDIKKNIDFHIEFFENLTENPEELEKAKVCIHPETFKLLYNTSNTTNNNKLITI